MRFSSGRLAAAIVVVVVGLAPVLPSVANAAGGPKPCAQEQSAVATVSAARASAQGAVRQATAKRKAAKKRFLKDQSEANYAAYWIADSELQNALDDRYRETQALTPLLADRNACRTPDALVVDNFQRYYNQHLNAIYGDLEIVGLKPGQNVLVTTSDSNGQVGFSRYATVSPNGTITVPHETVWNCYTQPGLDGPYVTFTVTSRDPGYDVTAEPLNVYGLCDLPGIYVDPDGNGL